MLNIKQIFFLTVFILFSVNFVSAGISIPSQVEKFSTVNVILDFGSYSPYVYFYNDSKPYITFGLNCSDKCFGEKIVDVNFKEFVPGNYEIKVYSYDDNLWISEMFEVVLTKCSDGSSINQCSNNGQFCNEFGELVDDCSICKCAEGYDCGLYNSCERIICSDSTLSLECSSDLGKYCTDTGELIDDCSVCGCLTNYECLDNGMCVIDIPIGPNKKIESLYSDKKVFLVSDMDWKEFLPFVPVTTWTGDENCKKGYGTPTDVCVYPTFVYHEEYILEGNRFDIDSIIDFMQKYFPSKVTIIGDTLNKLDNLLVSSPSSGDDLSVDQIENPWGSPPNLGAGLSVDQIEKINSNDYLFYWESFDKIVYVEDDYELALLASTYASLINSPLIIQGTLHDSEGVLFGREVICVGSVSPDGSSCSKIYSLEQLRQEYRKKTGTDKVVLVNPTDWDVYYTSYFNPSKSYPFYNLYAKTSLVSPILASAKHQLLLSTTKTSYPDIDSFLKPELQGMNYLTIMGSTYVIPHKKDRNTIIGEILGYDFGWALDASRYADITGDNIPDVAVGRIAGISNSDVSSYVARSLFYDSSTKTNNVKFMASSFGGVLADYVHAAVNVFSQTDYNVVESTTAVESFQFSSTEWENQDLIFYVDHGNFNWAGIYSWTIPNLDNSLILSAACLTVSTYDANAFWARAIRKGAISYIGATSTTALNFNYFELLNKIYRDDNPTIGDAFKEGYSKGDMVAMTTLIGDPTFDVNPTFKLEEDVSSDLCSVIGYPCLSNDWCCNGLECNWFICEDCKLDDKFCLKDGDCCANDCKMLECGLREEGESCISNGDCENGRCAGIIFFRECSSGANGKLCDNDHDCLSGRCSLGFCKACISPRDGCIWDGSCCSGECAFVKRTHNFCCCWKWSCGCRSRCGTWNSWGPDKDCD